MTLAIVNDSSQPRNVLFDYFAADDEDDDRPLRPRLPRRRRVLLLLPRNAEHRLVIQG